MNSSTKQFGNEGEEIAVRLLLDKGYEIVERNYRYGKGEIDIIAHDLENDYMIFCEVKSRKNLEYGSPEYSITKNKMRQLKKIAELYLFDKEIKDVNCRFDVITILLRAKQEPVINHYVNAF